MVACISRVYRQAISERTRFTFASRKKNFRHGPGLLLRLLHLRKQPPMNDITCEVVSSMSGTVYTGNIIRRVEFSVAFSIAVTTYEVTFYMMI